MKHENTQMQYVQYAITEILKSKSLKKDERQMMKDALNLLGGEMAWNEMSESFGKREIEPFSEWTEFWSKMVLDVDGRMDEGKLKLHLAEYSQLMRDVKYVYAYATANPNIDIRADREEICAMIEESYGKSQDEVSPDKATTLKNDTLTWFAPAGVPSSDVITKTYVDNVGATLYQMSTSASLQEADAEQTVKMALNTGAITVGFMQEVIKDYHKPATNWPATSMLDVDYSPIINSSFGKLI